MNRKQRRALSKKTNKEAVSTIDLMLSMPDQCLTCQTHYDKLSKEMASTWFVEVYKENKKINLYCPDCYKKR